jgi:hypothetical protein
LISHTPSTLMVRRSLMLRSDEDQDEEATRLLGGPTRTPSHGTRLRAERLSKPDRALQKRQVEPF